MLGRCLYIFAVTTLFFPATSRAQEALAAHAVKDSFAPAAKVARGVVDLGSFNGTAPPSGAAGVPFDVAEVRFTGDPCPVLKVAERLRHALKSKGLTVADLYGQVHAMEQSLSDDGYVLMRVIIPPQRISPGNPVTLKIVDGRIEEIDASALPEAIRAPVQARLATLLQRPRLRRAEIERALLIAGDYGGLDLRSTFAPGREPGGVRLILDGTFRALSGTVGTDRMASDAVGSWETGGTISLNSPFGFGEQFYMAYQGDPATAFDADARMRVLAAGAQIPLGVGGLTVSPEFAWARINPEEETGVPQSRSEMARASLKVAYPWLRQVDGSVAAYASVEAIDQHVEATDFGIALSSDSYLAFRSGLDAQWRPSADLAFSGALKLSQGLGGTPSIFGGDAGTPSTHVGAKADFTKIDATASLKKTMGAFAASVALTAQTSFGEPLFNSEQLGLDGPNALPAMSPGAYVADEGATLRMELERATPVAGPVNLVLAPYLFTALGAGWSDNQTAVESATIRAAGLGAGLRMRLWQSGDERQSLGLGLEFGHTWIETTGKTEVSRANLSIGWNF